MESNGPQNRPSEPHEARIRQDLGNAELYDSEDEAADASKTYKPVYQGVACLHEIKGTHSVQGVCGQDCQLPKCVGSLPFQLLIHRHHCGLLIKLALSAMRSIDPGSNWLSVGLDVFTEYLIRVRAANCAGWGPCTVPAHLRTAASPPSAPLGVQVLSTSPHQTRLPKGWSR